MRAMKDSGVEWLGEVPEGWGTVPVKRVAYLQHGSDPRVEGDIPVYGSGSAPFKTCGEYKEGPTVLLGRKGTLNCPQFLEGRYWNVDTAFNVTMRSDGMTIKFFFYAISSADPGSLSTNTVKPSMTQTAWYSIKLPLPPIDEQRRIADYLDEKCAQIDRAIASAEQSVEEYVAYKKQLITDVIERLDFEHLRLRHICTRVFDGPFGSHLKSVDYIDSGVRVVRLENLKYMRFDDSKRSFVSLEKYETIVRHTVLPGDLIMATFVAKEVQVASLPEGIQYAVNKADCVGLRLKDELCCMRFVQYALSSNRVFHFLRSNLHGTTRDRVNTQQIKEISLPLPPLPEQRRIAEYLDEKCAQVDRAVEAKQAIIDELKAYKKSIIYEVVTGKREV